MKKIPQFISRLELMQAFSEGKRAYYDGKRRGYNPYVDIGHEQLASTWFSGWDAAQDETQGRGNNAAPPSKNQD